MLQVAWLHSEKGIIAVYPDMVAQNDRFTSSFDNRFEIKLKVICCIENVSRDSWFLMIKEVQESDAGKYICQLNTERPISISGTLSVVGTTYTYKISLLFGWPSLHKLNYNQSSNTLQYLFASFYDFLHLCANRLGSTIYISSFYVILASENEFLLFRSFMKKMYVPYCNTIVSNKWILNLKCWLSD